MQPVGGGNFVGITTPGSKNGFGKTVTRSPSSQVLRSLKPALCMLQMIGRFFKKLHYQCVRYGSFFQKKISPKTYHEKYAQRANASISKTLEKITALSNCNFQENLDNGKYLYIPEQLFLSREEKKIGFIDKKINSEATIASKMHQNVPGLKSHGIAVIGCKINAAKKKIVSGRVIPSIYRHTPKVNRLANCYQVVHEGKGIIRSAVINTAEKADEFMLAVREQYQKLGWDGEPLRIVSHQLNSPEVESGYINSQHQCLAKCEQKNSIQLLHLNTPLNRIYNYTKTFGSLLGVLTGEKKSHSLNIEGMTMYLNWLTEDLEKAATGANGNKQALLRKAVDLLQGGNAEDVKTLLTIRNEIQKKLALIHDNKLVLSGADQAKKKAAKQEIRKQSEEIKILRKQLKSVGKQSLETFYRILKTKIEDEIFDGHPEVQEERKTVLLFRRLLGMQLGVKALKKSEKMSRGQELLFYVELNHRLKVVMGINCKVGLDRTGFYHALILAWMEAREGEVFNVINNWDELSRKLNRLYVENNYDVDEVFSAINKPGTLAQEELRLIFKMRKDVLHHLLQVSLPITGYSTGIVGLNWGKGVRENLIPLNFIPPVVKVLKGESVEKVRLLKYSKRGSPFRLTPTGQRLLTQRSSRREG